MVSSVPAMTASLPLSRSRSVVAADMDRCPCLRPNREDPHLPRWILCVPAGLPWHVELHSGFCIDRNLTPETRTGNTYSVGP